MSKFIRSNATVIISACALLSVSSCVSKPNFHDDMVPVMNEWAQAQSKIEKGNILIRDGTAAINGGTAQKVQALSSIESARVKIENVEAKFAYAEETATAATDLHVKELLEDELNALEDELGASREGFEQARQQLLEIEKQINDGRMKLKEGRRLVQQGTSELSSIEEKYRWL